MTEKSKDPFGLAAMVETWMKSMGEFWTPFAHQGQAGPEQQDNAKSGNDDPPKGQAAMAAALKNWQAISSAMATPESMESLLKGGGAMPERCTVTIVIPSDDTPRIQEAHTLVYHILCELIEERVCGEQ